MPHEYIDSRITSNCIISQTKLRSAIDGLKPPSKYRPFPLSQMFSIFDRDDIKTFSAAAAACWFSGRPNTGASTVCRTKGARTRTRTRRLSHQK